MTERRAQILDAALAVAQDVGIGGLSMRAVAERVGVTVMALYRHVESKEALLDGLVGRVLAEVQLPPEDGPWEQRLHAVGGEVLALARRYPSVVPLLLTRVYVAPEAVAVVDVMYAILRDAGVPADQIPRVERLLSTFLLGYSVSAANNAFWGTDPSTHPSAPAAPARPVDPASSAAAEWWTAELTADLNDLIGLVNTISRAARSSAKRRTNVPAVT